MNNELNVQIARELYGPDKILTASTDNRLWVERMILTEDDDLVDDGYTAVWGLYMGTGRKKERPGEQLPIVKYIPDWDTNEVVFWKDFLEWIKTTGNVFWMSNMQDGMRGKFFTVGYTTHMHMSFHKHIMKDGPTFLTAGCQTWLEAMQKCTDWRERLKFHGEEQE
jgi:hypothetical protein